MIDNILYVTQNNVLIDKLKPMFEERDLYIDDDFIRNILKLRSLYTTIEKIYNNSSIMQQFIKALKKISGQ